MASKVDAARGLAWVRLDSAFPRNPKVLELEDSKRWRAIVAYVSGLGYSGEHGLDGFIPNRALKWVHATAKEATQLVEVGLWHQVDGGFEINDWHDYQPSAEQAEARRLKAQLAADARWKK